MNLSGETKYESIFFEDDSLPYNPHYTDFENKLSYTILKFNTQSGVPLEWNQIDLEGNILSTFAPSGWLWQLRNTNPYFDPDRQLIIHQVQIPDSEFNNNQSGGSLVTCIIVMRINKDDFANSPYFLIQMQVGGFNQTNPPFGNPERNTVWNYVGINENLNEVYYMFGGNTTKISWGIVKYDESNVIDNLNMVSRTWPKFWVNDQNEDWTLRNSETAYFDYNSKTIWRATWQAPIKANFANGSYISRADLTPTANSIKAIRHLGGHIFEYFHIIDENLNTISVSDWDYEHSIYFKPNDPAVYLSNPIRTVVRVQQTKSIPLLSGAVVGGEQVIKNVPFLTPKPYLKQIFFDDVSDILTSSEDSIISNDPKNKLIYVLNTGGNGTNTYVIKKLDYDFNLLDTFDTILSRIRGSAPYVYNNNIILATRTGIYKIELNIILSNSSITQLNSFNQDTFSVNSNVFTTEIFFLTDNYIYLHSSTTSIDFDRYIKLDKNTGNIIDSHDMTPINSQINNFYFDENTYKLYHIRQRPDTNYKIFNYYKLSFDFDGSDVITFSDASGLFHKKISDKAWKYYFYDNGKLALKTVNVTNAEEISKIKGENDISSSNITGFEDNTILYNLFGGIEARKFVICPNINIIEPIVMKDLLLEYDLSKEETYDFVNQELVNTNSNYPNATLVGDPVFISDEKAIEFDGTNFGWIENIDYNRGEFTVEAYYLYTEAHENWESGIFRKWSVGPETNENEFAIIPEGGTGPSRFRGFINNSNLVFKVITSTFNYVVGQYYYVQLKLKNKILSYYIDNVLIGSINIGTDKINESTTTVFTIAAIIDAQVGDLFGSQLIRFTKCKIKTIRLYNRALTDEELTVNFNQTLKRHDVA